MNRETRAAIKTAILFLLFLLMGPRLFTQNRAQAASGGTLNLEDALKTIGASGAGPAELSWDPFFSEGTISAGEHTAAFSLGPAGETGPVLLDRREVLNLPQPYREKGNLRFPESFVAGIKNTFGRYYSEENSRLRIAAIIIDPGHGGRDSGTAWSYDIAGKVLNSVEKDIVLDVSRRLRSSLKTAYPDKQIFLTRENDETRSLEERVIMANSVSLGTNEAAIYVSVHANSSFNRSARGFEVWYLTPTYRREVIDKSKYEDAEEVIPILNSMLEEELTTESILLSNSLLKRMGEVVGSQSPSRGLKSYDWFVVRNARMPSVLVELGFVSNRTDALLMSDDAYLKKLSEALYKGISDFVAFFERSGGFTVFQ